VFVIFIQSIWTYKIEKEHLSIYFGTLCMRHHVYFSGSWTHSPLSLQPLCSSLSKTTKALYQ